LNNLFQHDIQIVLQPSGNKIVRTQGAEIFHMRFKFLHSEKKSWRVLNIGGARSGHKPRSWFRVRSSLLN